MGQNIYDYIHFNKQNFLNEYNQSVGNMSEYTSKIENKYRRMASAARSRLNKQTGNSKSFEKLVSLISSIKDNSLDKILDGEDLLKYINTVRTDTYEALNKNNTAQESLNKLSTLVSGINNIVNEIGEIDKRLLDFYASNSTERQASLDNMFQKGDNISILNINPTAFTSLESLKKRAQFLSEVVSTGNLGMTTTFKKADGTVKTYSVSNAVYGIIQLITNILGGYGEACAGVIADKKMDEMLKSFADSVSGITNVSISGTGTSNINGKVSKSDINISYNENGIQIGLGISAKAQKISSGTKTTFQTSDLKVFLQSVEKKIKYVFLNNLYHNRTGSNDYIIANRYIAAKNFDNAVTGINFAGNQQVYFLFYLNKICTVADFYDSLANKAHDLKALPFLSIQGKKKTLSDFVGEKPIEREDLTPEQKSIMGWQHSNQIRNIMLGLKTQVQFKH